MKRREFLSGLRQFIAGNDGSLGNLMITAPWLDIATAPKDGTKVDLWVVASYAPHTRPPHGYRVTNAEWSPKLGWTTKIESGTDRGRDQPVECDGPGALVTATRWMPVPPGPLHVGYSDENGSGPGVRFREPSVRRDPLTRRQDLPPASLTDEDQAGPETLRDKSA